MPKPDWAGLDPDGVADFVEDCSRRYGLTEDEAWWLRSGVSQQLGLPIGKRLPQSSAADSGAIQSRRVGDGLTAFWITAVSPDHPLGRERKRKRARGARTSPFGQDIRHIQHGLEDLLWRSGCLHLGHGKWLLPDKSDVPFAGAWWYYQSIMRHLMNAKNQIKLNEVERAAWHAMRAGELLGEFRIRVAHNDFFEKRVTVAIAQSNSGLSRRASSDELRREGVRHYMQLGDKPTVAAQNAADDLGISLSSIRRAFPNSRLPETLEDF